MATAETAYRQEGSTARGAKEVNVGRTERIVSMIGGGWLTYYGMRNRSMTGLAAAAAGGYLVYRGKTGHCALYESMGINTVGGEEESKVGHGVTIEKHITVNRSPEEVYRYWHDFENLPNFMSHLESVTFTDATHSHWTARTPFGTRMEWNAETVDDRPNESIGWRSLPGSDLENEGDVQFRRAAAGQGTEIRLRITYYPPGGEAGATISKLFNSVTSRELDEDLQRFKQIIETRATASPGASRA